MNASQPDMNVSLPQTPPPFKVMAIYKFADLPDCAAIQPGLAKFCCARSIRGTLILAPEGINGTVAGTPADIDALVAHLEADPRFLGAEIKFATAQTMPFLRMKVRLKAEIVTLRAPEANPAIAVGTYVEPEDWNALIARNDIVLVDTRNDYEVNLGTFHRALDPATKTFTEFKDYVAEHLDPARDKKVAMFCTGGIRCEKASSYLLSQGFEEVFHLKGGILKYLEVVPPDQSLWQGECFVFDERVAVTHGLEKGDASLCRACRMPLTAADRAEPTYLEGISCPHCADDSARHAAAAERQRQMQIARARGQAHLGSDAAAIAEANRAANKARRERDRQRNRAASE